MKKRRTLPDFFKGSWPGILMLGAILFVNAIGDAQLYNLGAFWQSTSSITWKQEAQVQTIVNANSITDNPLTNVATGDLIVCVIYYFGAGTQVFSVTDTSGNTYSNAVGPTTGTGNMASWNQEIWYAGDVTGGASVSVTAHFNTTFNTEKDISCHEYAGASTTNPFDVNSSAIGSSAAPASGSATTNYANELIFGADLVATAIGSSPGAGFTNRSSFNNNTIEDKIGANAGSYNATFSATGSNNWLADMATFTPQRAITIVQAKHSNNGGSSGSVTVKSTGTGNLLVVGIANESGGSVTGITDNGSSGGNTYVSAGASGDDGTNDHSEIWYAKNSKAGATTVTVNINGAGGLAIWFAEVSGLDPISPLDVAQGTNASGVALTSPQVTPSTSSSFVFSVGSSANGITGIHAGNPFTAFPITNGDDAAYDLTSAGGTYGAIWNQNSGSSASSTAAFRPGGTACGPIKLFQAVPGNTSAEVMNAPGNTKSQTITETAGHLLVAIAYSGQGLGTVSPNMSFAVSDTLGNTYYAGPMIENNTSSSAAARNESSVQIFYAANVAGGSNTVTVTSTTPYPMGISTGLLLQEYSGAALTNVVDVASGQSAVAGTTSATPGNATTTECDMVVGAFVDGSQGGQSLFAGNGWRQESTDDWCPAGAVDDSPLAAPMGSVVNASMNFMNGNSSTGWAATQVAFRASNTTSPAQPTQIAFTTAPQTLGTWTCSGVVTVQSQNGSAAPTTTSTGISLGLSGPAGVTFYADPACIFPVTSTYLGAGTNSQSFYFETASQGSPVITVTPSVLSAINQTETINAANGFTWIGGGGCSGNWPVPPGVAADKACWSGNTVPGNANVAHFDGTCTAPCNANISGNISVGGIWMHSTYTGVISQGANTTTVKNNFEEDAGTFTGGTTTFTVGGDFALTGGNFTSTSGNLVFSGSGVNISVTGAPIFTANNGTVYFGKTTGGGGPLYVSPGSITLNNVFITQNAYYGAMTLSGTLNIGGNLTDQDTGAGVIGGTLSIAGNLTVNNNTGSPGSAGMTFVGGNAQTITVTAGSPQGGAIIVNKTPGTTVSLASAVSFGTFMQGLTITSGILNLNGFNLTVANVGITITDTLVAGSGSITDKGPWNDPSGTFSSGTGTVTFSGTSSVALNEPNPFNNLTLNNNSGQWNLGSTTTVNGNLGIINGTLASGGNQIHVGGNWSNSGTYTANANTVVFAPGASHSIAGPTTFYNLTMNDSGNTASDTLTFTHGAITTVSHTLTLAGNATADLKLRSDSTGNQFTLHPPAATTLGGFIDVEDSSSTAVIHSGANSVNSGNNNANWNFP